MERSLQIAVVGVGYHGRHHARNLAKMPECQLVAVVDPSAANGRTVAEACGCRWLPDHRELVDEVDAVVVATPTIAHFAVAADFLSRGIATLVEKPLAFSVAESTELVQMAQRHAAVLQVGHIERYNPAFQRLRSVCQEPMFLEFRRYSRFPFRSLDVSVVFDVMIHDIDLALALVDGEVERVDARGACVVSPSLDRVDASIQFANGAIAHLSADRTHSESNRGIRAWNRAASIEADLQRRSVQITRKAAQALGCYPPTLSVEQKKSLHDELLPTEIVTYESTVEPLRLELEDFLSNAREHREPEASGAAGLRAVELATQIESLAHGVHRLVLRRAA